MVSYILWRKIDVLELDLLRISKNIQRKFENIFNPNMRGLKFNYRSTLRNQKLISFLEIIDSRYHTTKKKIINIEIFNLKPAQKSSPWKQQAEATRKVSWFAKHPIICRYRIIFIFLKWAVVPASEWDQVLGGNKYETLL